MRPAQSLATTVVMLAALACGPQSAQSVPAAEGACAHETAPESACAHEAAPTPSVVASPPVDEDGLVRRGAPLRPETGMPISALLARVDEHVGDTVTVEGRVRRSCTRKGCWLDLASSMDPAQPGARVTFRDYAFFVPLDAAGSTAKVQGVVEAKLVSAAAVAHYESEGAAYPNKLPDGSAHEVRIVASGVELRRP